MMVEPTMVSWAIPPAMMPGTASSTRAAHLGGELRPLPGETNSRICRGDGDDEDLQQPEAAMPQASAVPAALWFDPPAAIKTRSTAVDDVGRVGAKAATAKAAISVEDAGIERDHRHEDEKGSTVRAKRTASANFSRIAGKIGARMSISHGMTISPRRVKATSSTASPESAWPAKARAPSGSAWRRFEKSGMKAASNAPSANSRRNMLGMRKATKNASATGEAPSGRDQNVADETEHAARDGDGADSGEAAVEAASGRLKRLIVPRLQRLQQTLADGALTGLARDLLADEVGHVEHVDRLLAEGGDMGRGNVEIEIGNLARDVVEGRDGRVR